MPVKPFGIPPQEAIKLIKAKGFNLLPSFDWRETWAQTHAAAFTVAKSAGFNVLGDIYEAVLAAQEGKLTFKEFREQLQPTLEAKGWWGRKEVTDPITGELVNAQLGSPRRLEIIYRTNIRQAEAAGKWARIQALKEKWPYLRYVCIMDQKTREEHKAWHGLILPIDHPFWDEHMPPNGWNCRCEVMQLSQDQLDRWGWSVSDSVPYLESEPWLNERTGEELMIPRGVDPAFANNPGKVAIDVHAAQALGHTLTAIPPAVAAQATAASADFVARALAPQLRAMIDELTRGFPRGRQIVVGSLVPEVQTFLSGRGLVPQSGAIGLSDKALAHLLRESKTKAGKALSRAEAAKLTHRLANPRAILFDEADGSLLYVFDSEEDPRSIKVVVEMDAPATWRPGPGEKKKTLRLTQIKTAGLVPAGSLKGLKVIKGALS